MAKTKEGDVKKIVKAFLEGQDFVSTGKASIVNSLHVGKYHMPVSNGMGVTGIPDFYGHYKGLFFEIETKVPGKDPTALQAIQLNATEKTGAMAFVVRCEEDLKPIKKWFDLIDSRRIK